jgi:succinate dehydrogenase / fumarate reductase iron-sulfur subunit
MQTFILRIFRGNPGKQYWQEFELPITPFANVISCLMDIQRSPVTVQGERVEPVVWEQGCLEEVCGSCSMLVNGRPRQACTALIEPILKQTKTNVISLAPFTKFPLIRDLIVERSKMFDGLKRAQAWVDADGTYDRGFGPPMSQDQQEVRYALSTCMTCGCCLEACPQVNDHSPFVGPQVISQVQLFDMHPTGAKQKRHRLHLMMEKGGVNDCGDAQNCVKVCPRNIPLTDAIAAVSRDATFQAFKDVFSLPGYE